MGNMDSGNSGSIQSSSSGGGGDDQEYDSCHGGVNGGDGGGNGGESISTFLNMGSSNTPTTAHQLYSFTNGSSNNLHQVGLFNCFSSLECPNNNNQLDIVWPNKFPSINCTEGNLPYTSPNNYQQQSPTSLPLPAHGPSPRSEPGKNPKKRSRASRRAPTTVLTTDTTNFRQMVQEFTGIPDPPFTGPGTRYHLFSGLGCGNSSINSSIIQLQPSSYLLKPLHQPQFLGNNNNNTMNDALGLAAVVNTTANPATSANPSSGGLPFTTFQLCDPQDYPQFNFEKYSLPALIQQDSSMSNCNDQISCSSVNPAGGSYLGISSTTHDNTVIAVNGGLDNIGGGVTKGSEGMGDLWICSSD